MSRYYLSEAYASIYNPRLQEDFDDNLRFIDYMLDEDIEEVVESLFWEFRDYGNSIDESIELLRFSASSEIINESLEILSESRAGERRMQQRAEVRARQKSEREATTRGVDAKIRQDQRKARIDGAISRVKAAWKGATGGMGRAAKAVSSGISKAGEFVSQQRQAAKAKLQKLMRTGSQKVQTGIGRVQRAGAAAARELSGAPEREDRLRGEFRKNVSAARSRLASNNTDSEPAKTEPKKTLRKPVRRTSNRSENIERAKQALRKRAIDRAMATSTKLLPGSTEPTSKSSFAKAAKARTNKQNAALSRRLGGTTGRLYQTPPEKKVMLRASYEAMIDNIVEDLIYEGYAYDEYDALNIINNLNEDTLYDITQEYLAE